MAKFNVVQKGKITETVEIDVGDRKGKEALAFAQSTVADRPGASVRKAHAKKGAGRPKGAKSKAKMSTAAGPAAMSGAAAFFMALYERLAA